MVGRRTRTRTRMRTLLLEQRLTNCRGTGRLYQARLCRYSLNWKVMVF